MSIHDLLYILILHASIYQVNTKQLLTRKTISVSSEFMFINSKYDALNTTNKRMSQGLNYTVVSCFFTTLRTIGRLTIKHCCNIRKRNKIITNYCFIYVN